MEPTGQQNYYGDEFHNEFSSGMDCPTLRFGYGYYVGFGGEVGFNLSAGQQQ